MTESQDEGEHDAPDSPPFDPRTDAEIQQIKELFTRMKTLMAEARSIGLWTGPGPDQDTDTKMDRSVMIPPLPPISALPKLLDSDQTRILTLLFEPSPGLTQLCLPLFQSTTNPFSTYNALCDAVGTRLQDLLFHRIPPQNDTDIDLDAILSSHPRLGEKKTSTLSKSSKGEQAGFQSDPDYARNVEGLRGLNVEYEERFGGLRYTTFVNARPLPILIEDMRMRIERGDALQERKDAIQAMVDIAKDRAGKMGG